MSDNKISYKAVIGEYIQAHPELLEMEQRTQKEELIGVLKIAMPFPVEKLSDNGRLGFFAAVNRGTDYLEKMKRNGCRCVDGRLVI